MNAISISFGLLITLFAILLLYKMRKLKPQVAGYGLQRMCPYCGLITSRLKAYCLACGQSLTAVSVTQLLSDLNIPLQWSPTTGACTVYGPLRDFSFRQEGCDEPGTCAEGCVGRGGAAWNTSPTNGLPFPASRVRR